jgi:hypothetical protein
MRPVCEEAEILGSGVFSVVRSGIPPKSERSFGAGIELVPVN